MKYILTCCLVILSTFTKAQSFHEIQTEFHSAAFTGLYFLDATYAGKLKAFVPIQENCQLHTLNENALSKWTEAYLNKLPADKRAKLLTQLSKWCKEDVLLSSIANYLYAFNDFTQVIAETPATKHLLNKYLKAPGQYWGSLDASQACELYYDMVNYVFTLNREQRLAFYKSYFDTSCKIAAEEGKEVTKGIIKDYKGEPLIGASVHIKNTQSGTYTDEDGSFSLEVSLNDTLNISHIGFATQELPVSADSMAIVMQIDKRCHDYLPVDTLTRLFRQKIVLPDLPCIKNVIEYKRANSSRSFQFETFNGVGSDYYVAELFYLAGNDQTSNLDFVANAKMTGLKLIRITI